MWPFKRRLEKELAAAQHELGALQEKVIRNYEQMSEEDLRRLEAVWLLQVQLWLGKRAKPEEVDLIFSDFEVCDEGVQLKECVAAKLRAEGVGNPEEYGPVRKRRQFRAAMDQGGEVRHFSSDRRSWNALAGRAGLAVVHNGKVVVAIVTRES